MGPGALMQVLHQLPPVHDKDLIVGIENADDAGVYRISDDLAVVTTLDFFPPIVDDAHSFGAIAAANALGDVYAMGAAPRFATNIVCFPAKLGLDILGRILMGAAEKLAEAGAVVAGGHTVEDSEVKFGLSVTGFIDPKRIVTNNLAAPGDVLVLTKPIGIGVITTALKSGKLKPDAPGAEAAFESMMELNRSASEAMMATGVNACTDITGYGLLGHAMEMAKGSGVNFLLRANEIEFLPDAMDLVGNKACRPRAIRTTMEYLGADVDLSAVDEGTGMLLFDPQTSGGLLISVAENRAKALQKALLARGVRPSVIGRVVVREKGWRIKVA